MAKPNKISGKKTRKQIEKNLEITLAALEPVIGNKDFKRRLKKAGKVFTKGLKNQESQMALEHLRKLNGIKGGDGSHKKNQKNPSHPVKPPQKKS